jgi:hypothetical protein
LQLHLPVFTASGEHAHLSQPLHSAEPQQDFVTPTLAPTLHEHTSKEAAEQRSNRSFFMTATDVSN